MVHIIVGLCVDQILPAVNSAFSQKTHLRASRFAHALCAAHIHIRFQYRTSQIFFFFQKPSQLKKTVLKQVEENAKSK